MNTQIKKWGNSLAVRIPKGILLKTNLAEGEHVFVGLKNGVITLQPTNKEQTLAHMVSKINKKNQYQETDWGVAVGNEVW
jgi:antitoxin MazE